MTEYILNPAVNVEKARHPDPEVSVHVVDDFLENAEQLLHYAQQKAYFGQVGDDRTAYPGIRDRLPRSYDRVLQKIVEFIYGVSVIAVHRSMLSLTTLDPGKLGASQKIPHVDSVNDSQYAAVHYLCGPPHGGTAFYRYLPRNLVRVREQNREVIPEMLQQVHDYPEEHRGYLVDDTKFYRRELTVDAHFNRLVLYPSNLLHCAILDSPQSYEADVTTGRLTVASFFQLEADKFTSASEQSDFTTAS